MIRTTLRLLVLAACLAGMTSAAHAESGDPSGVPPLPQCYTLSTNPPAGPYDPEVTVCRPDSAR